MIRLTKLPKCDTLFVSQTPFYRGYHTFEVIIMTGTKADREKVLKLLITTIQAAPETFPKNLRGEDFAKHLANGTEIPFVWYSLLLGPGEMSYPTRVRGLKEIIVIALLSISGHRPWRSAQGSLP
jgi:hypothetical protein